MATTNGKLGFAAVFFTAISTILGAILFLRFGYATGALGFWGVIILIIVGHMVTIPTAMALSEIATNKRVEGGGEYFIISRSFGLNIGSAIGIALFFSQAISVAFYVIAFTEAFAPFFSWIQHEYALSLPRQAVSVPVMLLLTWLILKKGSSLGLKMLYVVVGILALSLVMFFMGSTEYSAGATGRDVFGQVPRMDNFFTVFAICFPAFTGMTAGVGLSGDLRNPGKAIPWGTMLATVFGMVIYVFIAWKLSVSASANDLLSDQMIMAKIAIGGTIIIPLGLGASTLSSALGSVLVAPRTLQALAKDEAFPVKKLNRWLSRGKHENNEPVNGTAITAGIALIFVIIGDVNAVAEVISMFFMVTYGSLCLISFLYQFGADPSYRPRFRSRGFISLTGFAMALFMMFRINTLYAILSVIIMLFIYLMVSRYHRERRGLESIFQGAVFQLSRRIQIYMQRVVKKPGVMAWRPSAVCVSGDTFKRLKAFELVKWIAYRYGFGTYIHLMEGYYSAQSHQQSVQHLQKVLKKTGSINNHVFIDTLISPSYTSAIAQIIQLPGISGMENNLFIFEFDKAHPNGLNRIVENCALVMAGSYDVCILGSSSNSVDYKKGIHIWLRSTDTHNSSLMILLGFIIQAYPDWRKGAIRIFDVAERDDISLHRARLREIIHNGRLPITEKNIELIEYDKDKSMRQMIAEYSADAGLIIAGFRAEQLKHDGENTFLGYDELGDILFVHAQTGKPLE